MTAEHSSEQPRFQHLLAEKVATSLEGPLPELTPRQVPGAVHLPRKATAVVGMRRAGKTTFLHQIRRARLEGGAARESLPYVNFEDERLAGLPATELQGLVEEHFRRHPRLRDEGRVTWCLDEIQVVPGWERFVRRLLDEDELDVFVTGSSAALLSREIASSLRGRAWEVLLHPFSFAEARAHAGQDAPGGPFPLAPKQRSSVESSFLDYLRTGGFPEAQGTDETTRRQLLRDYVDVAVLRDVIERHGVTNATALRWLVRHLLGSPGGPFSIEKFHRAMKSQGLSGSRDTLHELLSHLTDCFLVRTSWMESSSERQRMVNPRKAYPIDPGLIPVFDRSGKANTGHALETAVGIELERRGAELTYVRTPEGHEIDFLARMPDGSSELIQVCADASDAQTAERELRALVEAKSFLPRATRRLLVLTRDSLPRTSAEGVIAQPAYEWMLQAAGGG